MGSVISGGGKLDEESVSPGVELFAFLSTHGRHILLINEESGGFLNKLISNSLIKPYKPLLLFKVYSSSVNFFLSFFLFLLGFVKLYILITQSPCFSNNNNNYYSL